MANATTKLKRNIIKIDEIRRAEEKKPGILIA